MALQRFSRPKGPLGGTSPNLYVANCGPSVGLSFDVIASFFGSFGEVKGVYAADSSGCRVIVSFAEESYAELACESLNGHHCPVLGGRRLHICYSFPRVLSKVDELPVCLYDDELNVPGVYLLHDFITTEEEEELIAAVDGNEWNHLSKRRVQHYGFEFSYHTRNVNRDECLGALPCFVSPILERLPTLQTKDVMMVPDQLTVNEYEPGVGISPHIDTHSAFEETIFSLSLSGACVMELRKYHPSPSNSSADAVITRATTIHLPRRSLLVLSDEGRYAWHHYIPHRKVDTVNNLSVKRASRRISLTLRKVRDGPCTCHFPKYCDSRKNSPPHP